MQAIDKVVANELTVTTAGRTIDDISHAPPYPTWLFALAVAGGASALSVIFGVQHPLSVLLIAISAGLGAVLRRMLGKLTDNPFLQPFCAALLAGIIGAIAVILNLSTTLRLIAVVPCLVLAPGPPILNGLLDLIQARINLAVARLVYAGNIILIISSGLLLTFVIFHVSLPVEASSTPPPLLFDVLAAGVVAAAYSIFYSTPARMIGWAVVLGAIAHALRYVTLASDGNVVIAAFVASLFVGLVLTPIARVRHLPFAAIGFASVVSMIPTSYFLKMASGVLQIFNSSGATLQLLPPTLSAGLTAVAIILALGFGLVVPKIAIDHFMR
jgi:uncharacterized membrane protein YjjB (DUF3815 family)